MSTINSLRAFVIGGLVGAAVGLLYAPHSGEKTRKILVNNGQIVKDKAITSLHEAQVRMEAFTEETKKRLEKLEEIAQHTLEDEKQILKESLKQAKDVVGGNVNNGVSGEIYS
jgi:gas vesicle protein